MEENQAGPDSSNGPSQSEFRALSEVSGAPDFPTGPGSPAVPASNVDKACGRTGALLDEPSYLVQGRVQNVWTAWLPQGASA